MALWRWHAIEEIEHKAVAYDTWLHATRDWSRWKRWRVKSLLMLLVTKNFLTHRIQDALGLLAQDGITGTAARRPTDDVPSVEARRAAPHPTPAGWPISCPASILGTSDDRGLITQTERNLATADSST